MTLNPKAGFLIMLLYGCQSWPLVFHAGCRIPADLLQYGSLHVVSLLQACLLSLNYSSRSTTSTTTTMVTLLDVLSLPSCGFTSIHKIMEHELKKGLQQITGNPVPNIHNQDAIKELIVRKNKRKRDKWRFISLEKKWLETQRLLVGSLFYIYFIKYASTIPGR